MKLKKTIAYLLTMTLLFTLTSALLPLTAIVHANPLEVTFLTHWTEPKETGYWDNVIAEYNKGHPGIEVKRVAVEMDVLLDEITLRHISGTDTDIVSMHCMWLPAFANWKTELLAIPPDDVQNDVSAVDNGVPRFSPVAKAAVTYKGIVWGYPTEYNSWAIVYNWHLIKEEIDKRAGTAEATRLSNVLDKLNRTKIPLSWDELKDAARLLTKWDRTVSPWNVTQTGFSPFVEGMPEEQRFQFLSLLWSNGGEYLDLSAPRALFNTPNGVDVMNFYYDLGYNEPSLDYPRAYDPLHLPDYWWEAYEHETVALMILPTWMTYIRDAMAGPPDFFNHLGVAPIPTGPRGGGKSVSPTYNWMVGVTQKAQREGRARAAWDFLKWIYEARPAGSIKSVKDTPPGPMPEAYGAIPKGEGVSIMGDWLIFDSIIPSKTADQQNGKVTLGYLAGHGYAGPLITADTWFKGFMDTAEQYGRSSKDFVKSDQVQYEIGLMFEKVVLTGEDPAATVAATEIKVNALLPMAGDIDLNGPVNILDANFFTYDAFATPADPRWNRGRSDIDDDLEVNVWDAYILASNFGRTGDP